MNSEDADKLLEQNLSGDPPSPELRARVLRASTAAFVRARRRGARGRLVALGTAATLIAAVSFLLGRASALRPATLPPVADAGDTVVVPSEVVAWVNAARLFHQLGMQERMARAVDRAHNLLLHEAIPAQDALASLRRRPHTPTQSRNSTRRSGVEVFGPGGPLALLGGPVPLGEIPEGVPGWDELMERANRIMAQSWRE